MSENREEYNALKPCPFCGETNTSYVSISLGGWYYCKSCEAASGKGGIDGWNTRPLEDALDHTLATIRASIEGWSGDPDALAGLVGEIAELCGAKMPPDPDLDPEIEAMSEEEILAAVRATFGLWKDRDDIPDNWLEELRNGWNERITNDPFINPHTGEVEG